MSHTLREVTLGFKLGGDLRSKRRLALDFVLFRAMKILPRLAHSGCERSIRLLNGTVITYRLNRGDIQSIREIFLDEAYRLPFRSNPSCLVDLGANIGLTSVWLTKTYGPRTVVAVEPDAANASLARRNLLDNGIEGIVIEAAIGSVDGTVFFARSAESNLGQVSADGHPVAMISMATLLRNLGNDQTIDVLKIDIEGGEQDLLTGNLDWLRRVRGIIAEFHPHRVDYPGLVRTIEDAGFSYIAADTVFRNNMDAFAKIVN